MTSFISEIRRKFSRHMTSSNLYDPTGPASLSMMSHCPVSSPLCPMSWTEIRQSVRKMHKNVTFLRGQTPQNFSFCDVELADGSRLRRLYFLSSGQIDTTLVYVDLQCADNSWTLANQQLQWCSAVAPLGQCAYSNMSKEEQLLRERKRLKSFGISSYDFVPYLDQNWFAFVACNSLYVCNDSIKSSAEPRIPVAAKEVPTTSCTGSRMDPKLCPCNPDLVAFICNNDIWVTNMSSGIEQQLTFSHKEDNHRGAGTPSFVIQEEFDRFTGYWWRPISTSGLYTSAQFVIGNDCKVAILQTRSTTWLENNKDDHGVHYQILYEEVDESNVDVLKIISPSSEGSSVDEYRYPKAGSTNATSTLKVIEFCVDPNGKIDFLVDRALDLPLYVLFPEMEYLLRAGWMPDGQSIYVEMIEREQSVVWLVMINVDGFVDVSLDMETNQTERPLPIPPSSMCVLYEEKVTDSYIYVHDLLHFLPRTSDGLVSFIRGSAKSGYLHIHHMTVALDFDASSESTREGIVKAKLLSDLPLTEGQWEVDSKQFWVDERNELVYFVGYKDTPLETHLYVVSYKVPGSRVVRLTKPGFSHVIDMDKKCSMFVTVFSSLSTPTASEVFRLEVRSDFTEERVEAHPIGILQLSPSVAGSPPPPEMFSYNSNSNHTMYGLLYRPKSLVPGSKYPVVLYVYGGPQVQLVTNSYKTVRFLRLHTLADLGYVVVVIDGRGSAHRGTAFESHNRLRLGTVEIADQVEGLLSLSRQHDFIDMNRVAIHGWSYGGYLALMGLVQRPDIFKVSIAGAPVTSWNLYDTGYTERYMSVPMNNRTGYRDGSVIEHADKFPNEEGRLLIIHGLKDENVHFYHTSSLVDALVKACKPYTLQVYPNERHGIRSGEANEHYETLVISFLQKHL